MGEIKSTLDLVMERTRGMSLSEEEKERQKRDDFDKRLQGLLQRYEDGALTAESLEEAAAALQAELGQTARSAVSEGVVRRLDPEGENDRWMALLERTAPEAAAALEEILAEHRRRRAERLEAARLRASERLARDFGIRGSSVAPNPNREPGFQEELAALCGETQRRIEKLRNIPFPE